MKKRRTLFRLIGILLVLCCLFVVGKTVVTHVFFPCPSPTRELIQASAAEYGLDPALVAAVIRCESGYDEEARSVADAIGLMQVTEPTFYYVNETLTLGYESPEQLWQPAVNIHIGCAFLSLLQDQFDGLTEQLCAYNAGPGRVTQWLADSRYSADGITLSAIPYAETEQYQKRVQWAYQFYQKLYEWK